MNIKQATSSQRLDGPPSRPADQKQRDNLTNSAVKKTLLHRASLNRCLRKKGIRPDRECDGGRESKLSLDFILAGCSVSGSETPRSVSNTCQSARSESVKCFSARNEGVDFLHYKSNGARPSSHVSPRIRSWEVPLTRRKGSAAVLASLTDRGSASKNDGINSCECNVSNVGDTKGLNFSNHLVEAVDVSRIQVMPPREPRNPSHLPKGGHIQTTWLKWKEPRKQNCSNPTRANEQGIRCPTVSDDDLSHEVTTVLDLLSGQTTWKGLPRLESAESISTDAASRDMAGMVAKPPKVAWHSPTLAELGTSASRLGLASMLENHCKLHLVLSAS